MRWPDVRALLLRYRYALYHIAVRQIDALLRVARGQVPDHLKARDYLAENGVPAVQIRQLVKGDKKLAAV